MSRVIAGAQLPREYLDRLPKRLGGLYFLYDKKGKSKICFYIGISNNLRRRLMNHEYPFEFFSFVRLTKKSREFLEGFIISAMGRLPGEKMKIDLINEVLIATSPEFFRGTKKECWVEEPEEE